jgi:hypothetical protein
MFGGRFSDQACLSDRVCQWFFAKDVPPRPKGRQGGDGVGVVGRGDEDGVDSLLVQEAAEIGIERSLGEAFARFGSPLLIHVAQGDNFRTTGGNLAKVMATLSFDPDYTDVEAIIGGGFLVGSPQRGSEAGGGGGLQKATAGETARHDQFLGQGGTGAIL